MPPQKKQKEEEEPQTFDQTMDLAMAQINREFGKGSIIKMDDDPVDWEAVSTGCIGLDIALGIKGLPRGRIVEIFGHESSGKSTISLQLIAQAQKQFPDKRCLFIDTEHALDPVYAQALGVDLSQLLFSQPHSGEQALEILDKMIKTGGISVAIVDSVAALTPQAEIDGSMEKEHMGLQPRMMAKALRKINEPAAKHKTLVVFTNQIREKIGIMFGNPETTPGGRALKFYSSVRLQLKGFDREVDKNGEIVGVQVRASIPKNKMGPPFKKHEFSIIFGKGVWQSKDLVMVGTDQGVLERKGAWYSYEDENIGQGIEKTAYYLDENPEIAERIRKDIYDRLYA